MWAERSELRELDGVTLFVDVTAPAPRLVIFGAVDYAAALCRLARAAGWRAFVCDPRSQFATAERFPDAEEVVAAWPEEAFARIGGIDRATYIAVLTHDPKLDDAALTLALRSEARLRRRDGQPARAGAAPRAPAGAPGWTRSCSRAWPRRSAWTWARSRRRRRRCRSWPRSWRCGTGASGGRLSSAAGRIHEVERVIGGLVLAAVPARASAAQAARRARRPPAARALAAGDGGRAGRARRRGARRRRRPGDRHGVDPHGADVRRLRALGGGPVGLARLRARRAGRLRGRRRHARRPAAPGARGRSRA